MTAQAEVALYHKNQIETHEAVFLSVVIDFLCISILIYSFNNVSWHFTYNRSENNLFFTE